MQVEDCDPLCRNCGLCPHANRRRQPSRFGLRAARARVSVGGGRVRRRGDRVPAVGQELHGGIKSGLFLAGYVVAGDTEDDVAANMDKVAAWFSGQARRRSTESMGGTQ
jgi:hypothetical protein